MDIYTASPPQTDSRSHPHNKKSSIKNNNVFKTKPTSGVTVVSAWLDVVKAIKKTSNIINFDNFI